MNIIGKIFKCFMGKFLFLSIICVNLYAVEAYLENKDFKKGDRVRVYVDIIGEDHTFPRIDKLGEYEVVEILKDRKKEQINGKNVKKFRYILSFFPKKSMTIPSFKILLNEKEISTKPIKLNLLNQDEELFIIESKVDKTKVVKNELIKLSFRFKYKQRLKVSNVKIVTPSFNNFWIQGQNRLYTKIEDGIITEGIEYYLYPRKEGSHTLNGIKVIVEQKEDVYTEYNRRPEVIKEDKSFKSFISKDITIKVNELKDTPYAGTFKIKTHTSKKQMQGNETINMVLEISGYGNASDIKPFKLDIKNVTIVEDKMEVLAYKKSKPYWRFFQRVYITRPTDDFIIPAYEFKYYDTKTKQIKIKKTNKVEIKVTNPHIPKVLKGGDIKEIKDKKKGLILEIINILAGFFVGVLSVLLFQYLKTKKKQKKMYLYKTDKELLNQLLIHKGKDKKIDKIIHKLNDKIYKNQKVTISRKERKFIKKEIATYKS